VEAVIKLFLLLFQTHTQHVAPYIMPSYL